MPTEQIQVSHDEAIRIQRAVEEVSQRWKLRFEQIGNDITLRKWCVEMAAKLLSDRAGNPQDQATWIYEFVTGSIPTAINRESDIGRTQSAKSAG